MEYSWRKLYEDTYSDLKFFFEWSSETAEIIEMCCILMSGIKIFYNFLYRYGKKNVMEYSERRLYEDTYSESKLFFEWSLETAEIIEMCCILTSGNKIFYDFLKSILEKKCNGIFLKTTSSGYLFRFKIVSWMVFRDGRNYWNVLHLNVWE